MGWTTKFRFFFQLWSLGLAFHTRSVNSYQQRDTYITDTCCCSNKRKKVFKGSTQLWNNRGLQINNMTSYCAIIVGTHVWEGLPIVCPQTTRSKKKIRLLLVVRVAVLFVILAARVMSLLNDCDLWLTFLSSPFFKMKKLESIRVVHHTIIKSITLF